MTTEEKKDQQVAQKPAESEKVLLRNESYYNVTDFTLRNGSYYYVS